MVEFLRSIPAAASSPYAFAAYAIAAVLFLFAGARLRMAKLLMDKITTIPETDRRRALEIATGTVLPTHVSAEQWIRHSRLRWTFLLLGSLLIVLLAIATIAILNPTRAALQGIEKTTRQTAKEIESVVQEGVESTAKRVDTSTEQIEKTTHQTAKEIKSAVQEGVESTAKRVDASTEQILKEMSPRTGLVLTMMKKGWLDADTRGRMYEFTLANPMSGVAIVESISVEVLDVIEDHYPIQEATLADFKYRLTLQPDFRGRYKFAQGFKYPSGDADKFTVLLNSSPRGYDYFFRFVVVWHDPLAQQKRELYSEVLCARYAEAKVANWVEIRDTESGKREIEEHLAKIRARRAEISAKLKKTASDVETNAVRAP